MATKELVTFEERIGRLEGKTAELRAVQENLSRAWRTNVKDSINVKTSS